MVLSKSSEEIQSKSWRDVLPVHPAAELLPHMSDAKLKELGEDIKAHGQQTPVVIFVDNGGKHWLLDGISRLEAMQRVGLQVIENDALNILVVDWQEIDEVDPVAYVLSANLHRRHLSARDKRELAGNLLEMFPSKSDRQIAEMVGLSHPTVRGVRTELEARGKIFHVETRVDTRGREQPATKPAKSTSATDPILAAGAPVVGINPKHLIVRVAAIDEPSKRRPPLVTVPVHAGSAVVH
jgi:DNA-binding Lrp family transcriptional regulator